MTTNTHLSLEGYPATTLVRYQTPDYLDLRAWDGADEHLLLQALPYLSNAKPKILVINDRFASIATVLREHNPTLYSDYATTRYSVALQACQNEFSAEQILQQMTHDLEAHEPQQFDLILLKIPKQKRYFTYLLQHCQRLLSEQGTLLLSGMVKHVFDDAFSQLQQHFQQTDKHRHHKKSLLFSASIAKPLNNDTNTNDWVGYRFNGIKFQSQANVYGAESVDQGSQFLLNHMPSSLSGRLLDLGCGNGLLGISLKQGNPGIDVTFTDDSAMAIASCQHNWQQQFGELPCTTRLDYGLASYDGEPFDIVVCNPPFHQDHLVSEHIARQLIRDATKHCKKGGVIYLVANSHLNYHIYLKRQRLTFTKLASNKKFVVHTIQM